MPLEDAEAIVDYILSGGTFSDLAIPLMFIRKWLCNETYKLFHIAITKAVSDGLPHNDNKVVDTLCRVIMNN